MVDAGADQLTVAEALPPRTESDCGAVDGAAGVKDSLATDSVPTPNDVMAATLTRSGVPLTRPAMEWLVAEDPVFATNVVKDEPPLLETRMR